LGILNARQHLINQRRDEGTWLGQRRGNASLPSQLILLLSFRGKAQTRLARQAAEAILWQQLPTGGWSAFPGGPVDVSVSVQAYFALKLTGHVAADERLSLARRRIRELGGADAADATTRTFLALLGQVDYDHCAIDDETLTACRRQLLVPLTIVSSRRPVRDVGLERGVRELFVKKPCDWPRHGACTPDAAQCEAFRIEQLRGTPINTLEFGEFVWHAVALESIGMDCDGAECLASDARLREFVVIDEHEDQAQPVPRIAPMIDTAMAIRALGESGLGPDSQVLCESVELLCNTGWLDEARPAELAWLSEALAAVEPTFSQPGNALPPPIQMAVSCPHGSVDSRCRFGAPGSDRRTIAHRLVERLLETQHADGGWGSEEIAECGLQNAEWGKFNGRPHPSAPEATGAVLEALAGHNMRVGHRAVDRAVEWLRDVQQADGSWDSTTGVRWIHGTSQAVRGMLAVGVPSDDPDVAAGVNWLLAYQQPSGGWGESISAEPSEPLYCPSPATATQTAWALLALLAAGRVKHEAVRRGIQFLLDTQQDDGPWDERQFTLRHTATGAWHRSKLHAVVWPLMALSQWAVAAANTQRDEPDSICLRLVDDASR
jgi:squalene-hopene/tetraprenyl-beta-curcumene cyclase